MEKFLRVRTEMKFVVLRLSGESVPASFCYLVCVSLCVLVCVCVDVWMCVNVCVCVSLIFSVFRIYKVFLSQEDHYFYGVNNAIPKMAIVP